MACSSNQKIRFQLRRALESDWYNANPILLEGEPAVSTDTKQIKIGNGNTWRNTDYINLAGGVGANGTPTTLATLIVLTASSKSGTTINLSSNTTLQLDQAVTFPSNTSVESGTTGGNIVANKVYFVFASITDSNVLQVKETLGGTAY